MYFFSNWEVRDVRTWKKGSLDAASRRIRTSGAEVYCSRHVPSNSIRSIGRPMLYASTLTYKHYLDPMWNQTEVTFFGKFALARLKDYEHIIERERNKADQSLLYDWTLIRWCDKAPLSFLNCNQKIILFGFQPVVICLIIKYHEQGEVKDRKLKGNGEIIIIRKKKPELSG